MFFKKSRRKKLRARPFPEEWRRLLESRWAYYRCLSPEDREELHGHVHVFLAEKTFEGCAGLTLTEEMRVLIAAQACVLLLRRDTDYYPGLKSILVYPAGFVSRGVQVGPAGMVVESAGVRAGESWQMGGRAGPVVLSWRDVAAGAAAPCDGRNVVFHEFAHQLDGEDGHVNGAPLLDGKTAAASWKEALSAEFARLRREVAVGAPTLLGSYAATSPAEFFAVATELFFERPRDLAAQHPEVYDQLKGYYKQDPSALMCAKGEA